MHQRIRGKEKENYWSTTLQIIYAYISRLKVRKWELGDILLLGGEREWEQKERSKRESKRVRKIK